MRYLILASIALLVGGCVQDDGGDPGPVEVPDEEPCPLEAPESPSLSNLRIRVTVDPRHAHGASEVAPYEEGHVRIDWWRKGELDKKQLEPEGCIVFTLDREKVPVQAYVKVPDRNSPSGHCSWGRAERLDTLNATEDVVIAVLKGCS